ncbi:hypothetical protein [Microbacterium tumbae]
MTPPRWKMAIVTWIGVYPIITLLLFAVGPLIIGLPTPLMTLILTVVLVSLLSFVVMPLLTRLFGPWLRPRPVPEKQRAD